MIKKRDVSLDAMKIVGILSAMIVHHQVGEIVYNILAYSVPMLIILSGFLSSGKQISYTNNLAKRAKKIIIPTYAFVIIVLALRFCISLAFGLEYYSINEIISTILLSDNGMGYVWIARVFFLVAIIEPLINRIDKRIINDNILTLICVGLALFSDFITRKTIAYSYEIWFQYTIYMIPYYLLFLIGKRMAKSKKFEFLIFISFSIIFIVTLLNKGFNPSHAKYPPQLQYVSYGVIVSIILYNLLKTLNEFDIPTSIRSVMYFLSINSFTIYLCQAFIIIFYSWFMRKLGLPVPIILEIVMITSCSVAGAVLINIIRKRLLGFRS